MSKETKNRIEYTIACISDFSEKHHLDQIKGYNYLKSFGGIDFLKDCYEAEHLLSIDDAIDDLTTICRNHGGTL